METYILMHENIKLASFTIKGKRIKIIAVTDNKQDLAKIPIGCTDKNKLSEWISNRGIPVTRQNLKEELDSIEYITPFKLMIQNKGLSLTDHYWACNKDDIKTWQDINSYTNDFKYSFSLDIKDDIQTPPSNFTPNASLKGSLKKKWIIDSNGVRRLVKGNYNNSCRQSLNEVLATKIHEMQSKQCYTPYSLVKISSDGRQIIGCECPNFTSIQTEFIPAIDIINIKSKPNTMAYYEFFITLCNEHGLNIRNFLEYQILTDFIISNTDRHLNNFGIIRDSKTLQWLSPAPIFDSGNAMFYKQNYIPVGKALLDIEVTSFLSQEVKLLKYITNRDCIDTRLLPNDNYLYQLYLLDNNITEPDIKEQTIERLIKAYNRKIQYILDFQNGADIWKYNYIKSCKN